MLVSGDFLFEEQESKPRRFLHTALLVARQLVQRDPVELVVLLHQLPFQAESQSTAQVAAEFPRRHSANSQPEQSGRQKAKRAHQSSRACASQVNHGAHTQQRVQVQTQPEDIDQPD